MSKFQIENVFSAISSTDNFVVCNYYHAQDKICNISFFNEKNARIKCGLEVGMWKIKSLKKPIQ